MARPRSQTKIINDSDNDSDNDNGHDDNTVANITNDLRATTLNPQTALIHTGNLDSAANSRRKGPPGRPRPLTQTTRTTYAGQSIALPGPIGVLKALPAEILDIVLTHLFEQAFSGFNPDARKALRSLARCNDDMKQLLQRELTHFFGRWSQDRTREGWDWYKISTTYRWVRDRSLIWDV